MGRNGGNRSTNGRIGRAGEVDAGSRARWQDRPLDRRAVLYHLDPRDTAGAIVTLVVMRRIELVANLKGIRDWRYREEDDST